MVNNNIVVENARILFRNFSGEEKQYNPAGNRNFCVLLDLEMGKLLENDGWNVRWLQPKDEGEQLQPYIQVKVSYDNIPPKIVLVSKKGKTYGKERNSTIRQSIKINRKINENIYS